MAAEVFAPDHLGGAGRWCHEVAKNLVKRGNSVTLIIRRSKPELPEQEIIDGLQVFRYGNAQNKSWIDGILHFFEGLNLVKNLWERELFDLCHIQQPLSGLITVFGSPRSTPFVYTYHSPWPQEYLIDKSDGTSPGINPNYWIRFIIERFAVRYCQKIIVLSHYSLGLLEYFHHLKKLCITIPGGIDLRRFSPAASKKQVRKELGIPTEPFLLFTVRNVRQRMGLIQLIDAIALLKNEIPEILLIIAGKGPLKKDIETKIVECQLQPYVKLAGEVSEEELPLYYQAADLFVLPTQQLEGFGLVTMESLACGTPVVATPVGANVEVVGGLDKRLITIGTQPAELAHGILSFYQENLTTTFTPTICCEYAQQFSWERVAEQVEQCYREVLNK